MDKSPGEEHVGFMQWAVSHGVKINGITPAQFPGRRLGMMATRAIEENEVILSVPIALMLTIDSIPASFVKLFPKRTSIHGILAAFLIHGDPAALKELDAWRRVWPTWQEIRDSMPVFWPEPLRGSNSAFQGKASKPYFLPPSISGRWNTFGRNSPKANYETRYQNLLAQQEKRLQDAWKHVVTAFPDTDWEEFAYYWAIINSRSFYYVSPGKDEPSDWNDAIGMIPFADYFNHVDDAPCDVKFDETQYTFMAMRRYEKGEEIYMSYGSHSNDFLLVEYGFSPDNNPSDVVYLDDLVSKLLSKDQKKQMADQGCLGNYKLTSKGPSGNTAAAACMRYMNPQDWQNYIAGNSQRGYEASKSAAVIRLWIKDYIQECTAAMALITDALNANASGTSGGTDGGEAEESRKEKLHVVLLRWRQIHRLCEGALKAVTY